MEFFATIYPFIYPTGPFLNLQCNPWIEIQHCTAIGFTKVRFTVSLECNFADPMSHQIAPNEFKTYWEIATNGSVLLDLAQ